MWICSPTVGALSLFLLTANRSTRGRMVIPCKVTSDTKISLSSHPIFLLWNKSRTRTRVGLSHSDFVLVLEQPLTPALLSWQDKTCKASTGLEIFLPGVPQTLCLLLVGICQWELTEGEASGWGEETSARLLQHLRDHKKPTNNSKVKPVVCCCSWPPRWRGAWNNPSSNA